MLAERATCVLIIKAVALNMWLLLWCPMVNAQTSQVMLTDSIIKQVQYYGAKRSSITMFTHLDKTVYVNNDIIWFATYLLNCPKADMLKHEVLLAALVNNDEHTVALSGKFPMGGVLGYGNLTIPDSIPPGNYSFITYTNRMINGKPAAYFVQAITLKTGNQPSFDVALTLDTLYKDPVNIRAILQADIKSRPLENAEVKYYLGKDAKTGIAGRAKTNVLGNYMLLIPKSKINPGQRTLEVNVAFNKEVKTLHLAIPLKQQVTDVRFYPEGGHLISGLPNRVGWEARTAAGAPIKTEALLYAGNTVIDTLLTDSYGMGTFNLRPIAAINYSVKLIQDNSLSAAYPLPVVLNQGIALHVTDALPTDTLRLSLKSNYTGEYYLLVHNYKQLFSMVRLKASPKGILVKVDMSEIPRGLNSITVLDSLKRPCAERLFFAHYNKQPQVSIINDHKEAGTREKLTIKVKLNNAAGLSTNGVVSVACVQDSRFTIKNDNNIVHYAYLQNELDDIPLKDEIMGTTGPDRNYLNELLMVRGWSKYKWPELQKTLATDTLSKQDSIWYSGTVTHFGKPVKKPVSVINIKGKTGMEVFDSNDKGYFTLANRDLYTEPGKKVQLIVNGKSSEYAIDVPDPYVAINKALAKAIVASRYEEPIQLNTQEYVMKGFERATNLREVKIVASNRSFINRGGLGANACGDYVCKFHILNCRNHVVDPENRAPIQGEMVNTGGGLMPYSGCADGMAKAGMLVFEGIGAGREFYGADYNYSNPPEPDYLSTICWKHSVSIRSDKEAEISFYTSDITGKFRIVVQGIIAGDVIYGEDSFVVKRSPPKK